MFRPGTIRFAPSERASPRSRSPTCELRARSEFWGAWLIGTLHPRVPASLERKCVCDASSRAFRFLLFARFGLPAMRQVPERSRAVVLVETHEFREIRSRQFRV